MTNALTFSLDHLERLETISQGQADDLKIDAGVYRVWLSRMTVADGMEYDNQVTIETFNKESGAWETFMKYQAA
jgi:hypothetical protein